MRPTSSTARRSPSSRPSRSITPTSSATPSSAIAAEKAGILKRGVTCIVSQQEDAVHERHRARSRPRRREAHRLGPGLRRLRAARPSRRAEVRISFSICRCPHSSAAIRSSTPARPWQPRCNSAERRRRRAGHRARARHRALAGAACSASIAGRCRRSSWPAPSYGSTAGTIRPPAQFLAQSLADLEERAPKPLLSHRRHDGAQGCSRLPRLVPRPGHVTSSACPSPAPTRHPSRRRPLAEVAQSVSLERRGGSLIG